MSDKSPFDPIRACFWLTAAVFLAACSSEGIVPQPVPVAMSYVLRPGYEVACVETLTRINIPSVMPFFARARRTFTCEVREKSTAVPERIMREK